MWPFSKSSPRTEAVEDSSTSFGDSSFAADYAEIAEQLQLRKSKSKVFGSDAHHFKLNPPLPENEIAQFETRHNIRLPQDYRGFLLHLGNGGAGPAYGLFKLGEIDDGHGHAPWHENEGLVGILAQPFPHTKAWNDLTGCPESDEVRPLSPEEENALFEKIDEWEQTHYLNSRHINGAIPICHQGCALRQWLVVSGPEIGHVWNDFRADEDGITPVMLPGLPRVSFLQWYRAWLNKLIVA